MMKLKKVLSGGQTGADQTGLECAVALGLATGGTAPKGWKTDEGPAPELGATYGLVQSHSSDYAVRTRQNVQNAEVTVWFGTTTSPGYWCTKNACKQYSKPFKVNPGHAGMLELADTYAVWNVAGNRRRLNPGVVEQVRDAFSALDLSVWSPNYGPTEGKSKEQK